MKLSGCFGPECKISGGYNLVGKDCTAIARFYGVRKVADATQGTPMIRNGIQRFQTTT